MWPRAAQYNLVGGGLETQGVRTRWDSKNSILLEKFIENDVVISEVDARAHAVLS